MEGSLEPKIAHSTLENMDIMGGGGDTYRPGIVLDSLKLLSHVPS